jgi:subtilase family serine protease
VFRGARGKARRTRNKWWSPKPAKKKKQPLRRILLELEELESRALLSANSVTPASVPSSPGAVEPLLDTMPQRTSGTISGYSPQAIQQVYGVSPVLTGGTNGSGQTIAIVDASYDPNIVSDVAAFNKQFGLTQFNQTGGPTFKVVTTDGTAVTSSNGPSLGENANWGGETSLDVEWAHAIAPGANILLVEAPLDSTNAQQLTDLLTGVSYAANAGGANVVSMSWGVYEFAKETNYDSVFTQNPNVTFVAAAGDNSARYGPMWPATSPYVLAVGGTSLNTTTAGGQTLYRSESGWVGSGGGYAGLEGEPDFQTSAVGSYGARLTPDVAFDATPNTGVAIYDTFGTSRPWFEVGGTSVGSPVWAGIVALADQKAGSSLGTYQVESTLYSVLHNATGYQADFHDVTHGSNGYAAGSGYDLVTGLGTPIVSNIVPLLAKPTVSAGEPATTGHGKGAFASSTPGFQHLAGTSPGGGLFVTTGSTTIPAPSQTASGLGAAPVAPPPFSLSLPSIASAMTPPVSVTTPTSTAAVNNTVLASVNLPGQGPTPAVVGTGSNLSGPSNAATPPSATVFGASGWSGTSSSWLLSSHGLHGPTLDRVLDDLTDPYLEEVESQPDSPILGEDASGEDAPALEASPAADDGSAADGGA